MKPANLAYALVTGASSGIGGAIAEELARRGHPLILVARRAERLTALADRIRAATKLDVVVLAQDLSEPGAAQTLYDAVAARGLVVDILVNNAGRGIQGRFLDMDAADIDEMFRLNIHALTHLTALFARPMGARGAGYVLQVASAAAFLPSPYLSAYAASKAYVSAFSEALRFELRASGVSVTTLYPGITTTEFNAVAHAKTPTVMDLSILSAEQVAKIGVTAMFRRQRAIVPGLINKINAVFSQVLHRGLVTSIAGWLLERANRHA